MRRFLGVLLTVFIMLSMAACQPPSENSVQSTPAPTPPPTADTGAVDVPLHIFYGISVPGETEYLLHEDGTVLFEYAYQHMQLHIADQNIADRITLDFLTRVDKTRANADIVAQQAKDSYDGNTGWLPYKYHIYYSPTRIDHGIVSLFGTRTTYTGGLHPDQSGLSVSYDIANGEYLTLGSILKHVDNKEDICELVLEKLESLDFQYSLFDGYEEVVKERFMTDESTDEAFYFTNNGLCFYFAPYELAPFSTGIISVELLYSELPGILNDAYFPDEYQPAAGTLLVKSADAADMEGFTQLIDMVLHPQGEQVLLYSDKTIKNLSITCGSWTPDGLYFMPEYVVFNSTGVSADKAIVIRMEIPEILPNLMVSYETANGMDNYYISKNRDDGSIILLPIE